MLGCGNKGWVGENGVDGIGNKCSLWEIGGVEESVWWGGSQGEMEEREERGKELGQDPM